MEESQCRTKRAQRVNLELISGLFGSGLKPALCLIRGDEDEGQLRKEVCTWLKRERADVRPKNVRRTKEKFVDLGELPGRTKLPPIHDYSNTQFYDPNRVDSGSNTILVLNDGEFGKRRELCVQYDDFLRARAECIRERIRLDPAFFGAAVQVIQKDQNEWTRIITQAAEAADTVSVGGLLKENMALQDPFHHTFGAACFHDQTSGTEDTLSSYRKHNDKRGSIVAFHQLAGVSFVFVALPSRRTLIAGKGDTEAAGIETDTDTGSFIKYQSWKKTLEPDDLQLVDFFEKDFLKEATKLHQPRETGFTS